MKYEVGINFKPLKKLSLKRPALLGLSTIIRISGSVPEVKTIVLINDWGNIIAYWEESDQKVKMCCLFKKTVGVFSFCKLRPTPSNIIKR